LEACLVPVWFLVGPGAFTRGYLASQVCGVLSDVGGCDTHGRGDVRVLIRGG
jgi:hypothetical protein